MNSHFLSTMRQPCVATFRNSRAITRMLRLDLAHSELQPASHRVNQHLPSSVFHYEFEFIHPFIDGNGRMGSADAAADSTVFITFMLKFILQTLENACLCLGRQASVNALQNAPVNIEGMQTPDAIIALVQADRSITRSQMAGQIGKDIRTIGRAIKKLQDEGKLQRIGSDKAAHWELL